MPSVDLDTLGIWSTGDAYLTERQMVETSRFVPRFRYERVEGSHWIPLSASEQSLRLVLEHLAR